MKSSVALKYRDPAFDILTVAECLFEELGFRKTTVADIARERRMSPANVYRFYSGRAEINEAVARRILGEIEIVLSEIIKRSGSAKEKLRACLTAIEKANSERLASRPRLHELIETAFDENWSIVGEHVGALDRALAEIINCGKRDGEFRVDDTGLAAALVRTAWLRFWHPRLMVECARDTALTVNKMVEFCLVASVCAG